MADVWFVAVAVLFTGYLILEGFDFGVGMLLPVLGRRGRADTDERRAAIMATIGPVWDGNEVWLITAVGAMFAAFPAWYAGLFSGMYLPILLVLLALIVRVCALEYRSKVDAPRWRARCDLVIEISSWTTAFGWGLVLANLLRGVAVGADGRVADRFGALFGGYALLGGATFVALFALHGATFLALKTADSVRADAVRLVRRLTLPVGAIVVAFVGWTQLEFGRAVTWPLAVGSVLAVGLAGIAARRGRDGWAFAATTVAVAGLAALMFTALWPNVLPSTLGGQYDLSVADAASSPYTLRVLGWLAAIGAPVVVLYQGWTYYVFRRRISAGPR
ncbi:cytochrome d ubiquinol oxidase subunit II [Skermania piniformis]|nr:cytochrome d ubiquinol oxidase subunit II [Skermania piniformis]